MRMRWLDLLFAHWPVPADALRPLIPAGLELDTFEGQAWLGHRAVPDGGRRPAVPAGRRPVRAPFPSSTCGRTSAGVAGAAVWFLSLDAGSRLAVEGARTAFHLPYFRARMSSTTEAGWVEYRCERDGSARAGRPPSTARYRPVGPVEAAAPGSLAAFLTDRLGLFAVDGAGRPRWTAIRHAPWPLQPAEAEIARDTMAAAHGIALPDVDAGAPFREAARRRRVVAAAARDWPADLNGPYGACDLIDLIWRDGPDLDPVSDATELDKVVDRQGVRQSARPMRPRHRRGGRNDARPGARRLALRSRDRSAGDHPTIVAFQSAGSSVLHHMRGWWRPRSLPIARI